jgi:hypothetical protein
LRGGALFANDDVTVANSTVAFNESATSGSAAIHFSGQSASSKLTLQSSIVANNTSGSPGAPADIFVVPGFGSLAGKDNLVVTSNLTDPSVITLTVDPKLGPLQFNGGPTRTHMLLHDSPALEKGNVDAMPTTITADQRGAAYPRTTGPNAHVDLGAVQFDSIFADSFNWQF